jgi:hypothetical protein
MQEVKSFAWNPNCISHVIWCRRICASSLGTTLLVLSPRSWRRRRGDTAVSLSPSRVNGESHCLGIRLYFPRRSGRCTTILSIISFVRHAGVSICLHTVKLCICQIRATQVRVSQISITQVGSGQVGSAEVRPIKNCIAQLGIL